jgi:antitoxin (DNA-binding transcriptional repressor) of toxin-antitoxin stability system
MVRVNVHHAKTHLSALLAGIEQSGTPVQICRGGKPVADLVPPVRRARTTPHPTLRKIVIKYDPTEVVTSEEWGDIS